MRRTLLLITTVLALGMFPGVPAAGAAVQAPAVQAPAVQARPVETLFADASAKEGAVRKALAGGAQAAAVLKAVRTVVGDYEAVVRLYPTSSYCDDALWRAARLSTDAFDRFGEARERTAAMRLLRALASQYPTSKMARQVPVALAALEKTQPRAPQPARPEASTAPGMRPPPVAPAPAVQPVGRAQAPAAIRSVRRTVLPGLVRVIIEVEREVSFHDQRLDDPARVIVDLASAAPVPALSDRTLRFDADTDPVRQVRVAPTGGATRFVIEAAGVSRYSVYALYEPFRVVIDCTKALPERSGTPSAPPMSRPSASLSPVGKPEMAARIAAPVLPPPRPARIEPPLLEPSETLVVAVPLPSAWGRSLDVRLETAPPAGAIPLQARTAVPLVHLPPSVTMGITPADVHGVGGLSVAQQLGLGISRIVIDPGHGGHDPGASGNNVTEAELVLDVALRLEKLLAKLPGVEVVLTRRTNRFVALQERTAIANRENADLFLSIHANASENPQARGVETYFLNFANSPGAAAVAARENAASGQTMAALEDVVKTIALNSKLDESRELASNVQREFLGKMRPANKTLKDLGVKQAPFMVLAGAAMPSVLTEISFLTNEDDARLLRSSTYRQRIANALFEGVRAYQRALTRVPALAQQ